jgi:ADP-ribose pyrophosphatase YjhB (NUDIX family)
MAHIHAQIDFVVSAFIVRRQKVLLVNHKKLGNWFAVGGHVELHETTDEAISREIQEETGLIAGKNVWFYQEDEPNQRAHTWSKLKSNPHNSKLLRQPWSVEIHDFPAVQGHRHLALVYLCVADTFAVELEEEAHNAIRWFDTDMLLDPSYNVPPTIQQYGLEAIEKIDNGFVRIDP